MISYLPALNTHFDFFINSFDKFAHHDYGKFTLQELKNAQWLLGEQRASLINLQLCFPEQFPHSLLECVDNLIKDINEEVERFLEMQGKIVNYDRLSRWLYSLDLS